jgi:transcriptional regulator with XRE-family HTH domain
MEVAVRRKMFGLWIRDCRKHAKLTQAELALALGYDSSQLISNIERGVSLLPSKRIPDFAHTLGCSLLELEVRYFQCSARNSSESQMPDLLLKYLPLIEVLELGPANQEQIVVALDKIQARELAKQAAASEEGGNAATSEEPAKVAASAHLDYSVTQFS